MSFLLAVALLLGSGLSLLSALRLRTGRWAVDLPLSWFAGTGGFAMGSFALRFLAGVRYTAATALAVLALPVTALALRALLRRGGPAPAASVPPPGGRWLPRPAWLFALLAAYVGATTAVVVLQGVNTPTQTDDGFRVRAFAPVLAFRDVFGPEAREVLTMAGPVPSYVPSLGWRLTGAVDHFHVNGAILVSLVAFLALAVALASSRGRPERGWAAAFAALSLPLFVYHCTTTYADATLALYLGAAFFFFLEFGLEGRGADAERALLLLLAAAMVKREGELVAGAVGLVLVLQVAWESRRSDRRLLARLGLLCLPYLLVVGARVASVGVEGAFPFLRMAVHKAAAAPPATVPGAGPGVSAAAALPPFLWAVFSSGSAGILYWVLPVAVALRLREIVGRRLAWALGAVAVLLLQAGVTSLWLFPEYTLNQGTVHRQLIPVSVLASVWLAALLAGEQGPPELAALPAAVGPAGRSKARRAG
ncbi:MAG TPA: hypothetical protein VMK42_06115 [Anaeromyxobacteraceae bacterium]|nr:hypothetical protein [Anaeromyxobacteraceae bacterium]